MVVQQIFQEVNYLDSDNREKTRRRFEAFRGEGGLVDFSAVLASIQDLHI